MRYSHKAITLNDGDARQNAHLAAAYNGTAPIEVSSGPRKVYRLSRRGNRRLNHAIRMVAVAQIRYRHSPGRACYDRKQAEGKTPKEALRSLKRRISDAIFTRLQADARQAAAHAKGPGGQPGNDSVASAAATPQAPALRPSHSRTWPHPTTPASAPEREGHRQETAPNLLTQRSIR